MTKLSDFTHITKFLFGGRARFMLRSPKTGKEIRYFMYGNPGNDLIFHVDVASDSVSGMTQYLGTIKIEDRTVKDFRHNARGKVHGEHSSVKAIQYLISTLQAWPLDKPYTALDVHHLGHCGACDGDLPDGHLSGLHTDCEKEHFLDL